MNHPYIITCKKCGKRKNVESRTFDFCVSCRVDSISKRYSANYKNIRKQVFDRDENKCFICKQIANTIHHLNCRKGDNRLENLISLCNGCHLSFHNKYGKNIQRCKSLEDFIKLLPTSIRIGKFGVRLTYEK